MSALRKDWGAAAAKKSDSHCQNHGERLPARGFVAPKSASVLTYTPIMTIRQRAALACPFGSIGVRTWVCRVGVQPAAIGLLSVPSGHGYCVRAVRRPIAALAYFSKTEHQKSQHDESLPAQPPVTRCRGCSLLPQSLSILNLSRPIRDTLR
jgi:hypothetical protein